MGGALSCSRGADAADRTSVSSGAGPRPTRACVVVGSPSRPDTSSPRRWTRGLPTAAAAAAAAARAGPDCGAAPLSGCVDRPNDGSDMRGRRAGAGSPLAVRPTRSASMCDGTFSHVWGADGRGEAYKAAVAGADGRGKACVAAVGGADGRATESMAAVGGADGRATACMAAVGGTGTPAITAHIVIRTVSQQRQTLGGMGLCPVA